jgi:hypothetical protein
MFRSIAFNLGKLPAKGKNTPPNRLKASLLSEILVFFAAVYANTNSLFDRNIFTPKISNLLHN